jgi:hypothetical protein
MAELIRRRAILPVARKLELMTQLCSGLGYAHRNGIIHRDIKPANLMITPETLKILDFGLARVMADVTNAALTRAGSIMGTPYYMSPEQIEGEPIDHRADIFAVGVVFYELLTYQRAFSGDSAPIVLHRILHGKAPVISDVVPGIDAELAQIVTTGLERDREKRFQNLEILGAQLASYLRRHPDSTNDDTIFSSVPVSGGKIPRSGGRESGGRTPGSGQAKTPNLDAIAQRRAAQIDAHIEAAAQRLAQGEYEAAIEQCEHVMVLDPGHARALEMHQNAHRALEDRQVMHWLDDAKTELSRGALTRAAALIEQSLLVRPDSDDAQRLQKDLRERRRQQERAAERSRALLVALEGARIALGRGSFDAALRSASEALAHDPMHEEARLLKQQAIAGIDDQRRQEDEQRAFDAVAHAREQAAHDPEAGIALLRGFSPPHHVVTEAIAALQTELDDLQRQQREEEDLRRQHALAEEQRLLDEEQRLREVQQEAERLRRDTEARALERDREDVGLPADDPLPFPVDDTDHLPETNVPASPRSPWYRRRALSLTGAAVVLVASGFAIWIGTKSLTPSRPPPPGPPSREVRYAEVLAQAGESYRLGDRLRATDLALSVPSTAAERAQALELLGKIRTAAATAAETARARAATANATQEPAYLEGIAKQKGAESHSDPLQAREAVTLFAEAEANYDRAASTGWTAEKFVVETRKEYRAGRLQRAIEIARSGLERTPKDAALIKLLDDIRQRSASDANAARAAARTAGAGESPAFVAAEAKLAEAVGSADIERQVIEYQNAKVLFERAGQEALATAGNRHAAAEERLANAERLRSAGNFDQALREVMLSLGLERSAKADALKTSIETAMGEAGTLRRRDAQIDDLVQQARNATGQKKVDLLQQAFDLNRSRSDISTELNDAKASLLRTDQISTGGATGSIPDTVRSEITKVLASLQRAFEARDVTMMRALWPGIDAGTEQSYKRLFGTLKTLQWQLSTQDLKVTGSTAVAECGVSVEQVDIRGQKTTESRRYVVTLTKGNNGGWTISNLVRR